MDEKYLKIWEPQGAVEADDMDQLKKIVDAFTKPRIYPKIEVNRFLFRGVPDIAWPLLPSLPRAFGNDPQKPDRSWLKPPILYHIEKQTRLQFMQKARLYLDSKFLPDDRNYIAWWQLMQHHNAKTRLLDWSDSCFMAAYFAVAQKEKESGAIWIVDHGAFSDRMLELIRERDPDAVNIPLYLGPERQIIPNDPEPDVVKKQLIDSNAAEAAAYEARRAIHGNLACFIPCQIPNQRMAAQRGWFSCATLVDTDHGAAIAAAFSNPAHDGREWCLRVTIPADAKPSILRELWRMNITAETIYCGLDGLGKAMSELPDMLKPDMNDYFLEEGLLASRKKIT